MFYQSRTRISRRREGDVTRIGLAGSFSIRGLACSRVEHKASKAIEVLE